MTPSVLRPLLSALTVLLAAALAPLSAQTRFIERGVSAGDSPSTFTTTDRLNSVTELQVDPGTPLRVETDNGGAGYSIGREGSSLVKRRVSLADGVEMSVRSLTGTSAADGTAIPATTINGQRPFTRSYVLVQNERIDVSAADSSAPTARLRIHASIALAGNGIRSENRIWSPVGKANLLVSGTIYRRSGNQRISDFSSAFAIEKSLPSTGPATSVTRIFGQGFLGATITPDYPGVGTAGGSGAWNELTEDGEGYFDLHVPNGSYVEFSVTCETNAEIQNFSNPQSIVGAALANYDISATGRVWATMPEGGIATATLGTTRRDQSAFFSVEDRPLTAPAFDLPALNLAGQPLAYALLSGPASLSGLTLTPGGSRGTVELLATQAGDDDFIPASFIGSFRLVGLEQTLTFPTPANRPADSAAFIPEATATSGLPVTFTVTGGPATTTDGRTLTLTGDTGTVYLLGRQLGDDTYEPTLAIERSFTVTAATGGAAQTIDFNSLISAEVGAGQLLLATASSGLPVTFTVVEGFATIGGINNNILSATAPGLVTVRATQTGGVNNSITYGAATPVERSFTATAATGTEPVAQTITFPALPDVVFDPETPLYFLSATADSGLPVFFELVSGPGTVSGSVITLSGEAGFVTVRATQPGDEDSGYLPAEAVERTFAVTTTPAQARDLVGAWLADFDLDGRALVVFKADGTYYLGESGEADGDGQPGFETGTYTWNPATGVLTATTTLDQNGEWGLSHPFGTMHATVVGDTLRFEDGEFDVTFLGRVASPESALIGAWRVPTDGGGEAIIAFLPDDTYFHMERDTADANGQTGMEYGAFSWDSTTGAFGSETFIDQNGEWGLSHPGSSFNILVTGDTIAFTDGDGSGTATRISADTAPELLSQTVRFNAIANRTFNPSANTLTLSATSSAGLPASLFTFAVSDGPATISENVLTVTGAGTITVTATHPGDATHAPASASRTFTVAKATQTIAFTYPAKLVLGADAPAATATASSELPVEFSVTAPATLEGDTLAFPLPGTFKITATQPGDANYLPAKAVVRTVSVTSTARLVLGALRQPYTGTPRTATVTGAPEGYEDDVVLTYSSRTYALSETGPTDAGSYTVTATFGSIKKTGTLVIEKAPLAVSFANRVRLVATANPTFFEPLYDGFLDDDTAADLAPTRPRGITKATIKSAEGDYPITFTGGLDKNYRYVPGAPATLHVLGFGGGYEALLVDGASTPVGKLTLAVSKNTLGYTGTLNLARETKAITVSSTGKSAGTTALVSTEDFASATATWTRTATGPDALVLTFTVSADGTLAGSLDRNGEPFATLAGGRFLYAPPARTPIEWAGQHTLALHSAFVTFPENEGPFPRGSGVATAVVSATNGNLTLKGKLADGATLTATLKPWITTTEDGELDEVGYVAWILPYGTARAESFLAGPLDLQPHLETDRFGANRRYIPSDAGLLTWKKAGSAKDKSYRAGFGPLSVSVSLDPWLPPVVAKPARGATLPIEAITLPQRLDLADNNTATATLTISHGPDELDLGELESALPTTATLAATSAPKASSALALTEFATPADNLTKWKLTSLNAKTGAFTGTFILSDQAKPLPAKKTPRTVTFTGTLRQAPADEGGVLVGTGFFLVPDFVKTTEQPSGEIRFTAPVAIP